MNRRMAARVRPLGGGGIAQGRVLGASERFGGGVNEALATPQDLLATIYRALGIPLDIHYEDSSGRPASIVGEGQPIEELSA